MGVGKMAENVTTLTPVVTSVTTLNSMTVLRNGATNRAALRDYVANAGKFHNAAPLAPFDPAGNRVQEFAIVKLNTTAASTSAP